MPHKFILLLLLYSTTAQPLQQPLSTLPAAAQDFLDAHNQARSDVNVPPLQWSVYLGNLTSLLVRRQRDATGCQYANLNAYNYGGNQLLSWGSVKVLPTPRRAVEGWVKEKIYYNYQNNTCAEGHKNCGVYTQVFWGKSKLLGCAQAVCLKEAMGLTICFYDPPGNFVGERPY